MGLFAWADSGGGRRGRGRGGRRSRRSSSRSSSCSLFAWQQQHIDAELNNSEKSCKQGPQWS